MSFPHPCTRFVVQGGESLGLDAVSTQRESGSQERKNDSISLDIPSAESVTKHPAEEQRLTL